MADESRIAQLIFKKLRGDILFHEEEELTQWANEDAANQALLDEYQEEGGLMAELSAMMSTNEAVARDHFEYWKDKELEEVEALDETAGGRVITMPGTNPVIPSRAIKIRRAMGYAAVILIGIGLISTWYYINHDHQTLSNEVAAVALAQAPVEVNNEMSEDRALLVLANGRVIQLDTVQTGSHLAVDPAVWKKDNNTIVVAQGRGASVAVPYRAMYHVQLPDGTMTTLNAGSTLRWSGAYGEVQRNVALEGEGYFDVVKDEAHPFRVKTNRWDVQVLGTVFSIRDYQKESHQEAILVSGGLVVQDLQHATVTLLPRQSAEANNDQPGIHVASIDEDGLKQRLAWERGFFNFDKRDMRIAIRYIAQWYGMHVSFAEGLPSGTLGIGDVQRDLPLGRLLRDLEAQGLHFVNTGDTIVVRRDK